MKLEDLSYEEQQLIAERLLTKKYGSMADVHAELRDTYGVSSDTLYRWAKQLKQDKHISFDVTSIIKSKSTLTDADGNVKMQWVKEDRPAGILLDALKDTINMLTTEIKPIPEIKRTVTPTTDRLCNVYISNDLHIGALMETEDTRDREWNRDIAIQTIKDSIDFLVGNSPDTYEGVVVDLGDILEMDNLSNMTPKSGHILDVDGRHSHSMLLAMEAMVYMVTRALEKHEIVYFYNINGNHDMSSGHAIRAFVMAWFRNNPRVVVCTDTTEIKYHLFGTTLIGMAHGDGLKMKDAGETMAADNVNIFSDTVNRYFHFGHNHKDSVYDGRLCKCESHRNLAPLNVWASHKGFRRQVGTMKCITYHTKYGEIARTTYNVAMGDDE